MYLNSIIDHNVHVTNVLLTCADGHDPLLQVKNQHLKSCAKSKGLSTAKLLEVVRGESEISSLDGPPPAKKQATLRNVSGRSDDDFKRPPPQDKRSRDRKTRGSKLMGSVEL